MFSAEDYLQGWVVYCIGVACILLFLWLVLRKSAWTTLRHLILLLSASVLLTPVTAYPDDSHLAPAFFVSLYEGVMKSGSDMGFQRGLAPIIAVALFATIFYGLLRLLWSRVVRRTRLAKKGATKTRRLSEAPSKSQAEARVAPGIADQP